MTFRCFLAVIWLLILISVSFGAATSVVEANGHTCASVTVQGVSPRNTLLVAFSGQAAGDQLISWLLSEEGNSCLTAKNSDANNENSDIQSQLFIVLNMAPTIASCLILTSIPTPTPSRQSTSGSNIVDTSVAANTGTSPYGDGSAQRPSSPISSCAFTLPAGYYDVQCYGLSPAAPDNTAPLNALQAMICPRGVGPGGTLVWSAPLISPAVNYNVLGQVILPYDTLTMPNWQPRGCNIHWTAPGGGANWYSCGGVNCITTGGNATPDSVTISLGYSGNNGAAIEGRSLGVFDLDGITLKSVASELSYPVTITISGGGGVGNWLPNTATASFSTTPSAGFFVGASWAVTGCSIPSVNTNYTGGGQAADSVGGVLIGLVRNNTLSFPTYPGSGSCAAIMHYSPPIAHFTNTIFHFRDFTCLGNSGLDQDCIVAGGVGSTNPFPMGGPGNGSVHVDGTLQAGFQGYVSTIENAHFAQLNAGYAGYAYAFSTTLRDLYFAHDTGTVNIKLWGVIGGASRGALLDNIIGEGVGNIIYQIKADAAPQNTFLNVYVADPSNIVSQIFLDYGSGYNTFLGPSDHSHIGGAQTPYCTDDGNGYCTQ